MKLKINKETVKAIITVIILTAATITTVISLHQLNRHIDKYIDQRVEVIVKENIN